jgi:hypothetical protein
LCLPISPPRQWHEYYKHARDILPTIIDSTSRQGEHVRPMQNLRLLPSLLKKIAIPLFFVLMISTLIDQTLNSQLENVLMSDSPGSSIWYLATAALISGLFFPLLTTMLCLYGIIKLRRPDVQLVSFSSRVLESLTIEALRSWGSMLRWGVFFIIPGLIRALQMTFVPYVVCLNVNYENGKIDALKSSQKICKQTLWPTLFVVIIFQIVVPLTLTDTLDSWKLYSESFFKASFCTLIDVFVASLSVLFLFSIFERTQKETQDELII